jgi:DNA-binding response OmpR family regulator
MPHKEVDVMAPEKNSIAVLVVEASHQAAQDLAQVLTQRFGSRLNAAATASRTEALRIVQQQPVDLVIANVKCGDGGGLTLCQQLRTLPQMAEVPILLLAENASAQDKIAGFTSGADDYVVRPIDERLLAARLELLVRIKHLAQPGE